MSGSQPAIEGDLGISGEWPIAPSSTISAVAATVTSAHAPASAGAHRRERARGTPSALCAATLTRARCPDGGAGSDDRPQAQRAVQTLFDSR